MREQVTTYNGKWTINLHNRGGRNSLLEKKKYLKTINVALRGQRTAILDFWKIDFAFIHRVIFKLFL